MKITDYFDPYISSLLPSGKEDALFEFTHFYKRDEELVVEDYDVFILAVPESRQSYGNEDCAYAPDKIRAEFYALYAGDWNKKIVDLGNLKVGESVQDTYVALEEVVTVLLAEDKKLIVLGGGQDLMMPVYKAHANAGLPLNFATADAYLDFQDGECLSKSYLSKMINDQSLLSKYLLLGYQSYLCSNKEVKLLSDMDFDLKRLGDVVADIKDVEPDLRSSNHFTVDHSVLKFSEAPGNPFSSPNGITAAQLCALTRYAAMSNNLQSLLFSEVNVGSDGQAAKVFAQALWYFIEGLNVFVDDFPFVDEGVTQKYHVVCNGYDLVFYKNLLSNRWWVQLPDTASNRTVSLLPCALSDYNQTVNGVFSKRLLKHFKFL